MARRTAIDRVPAPDEVRAALAEMLASDVFTASPQLAAFLGFVVEAVLSGSSERIKGYTIGVEVLKRGADFDPLTDPIVRVEATRLRRAMERYYAGPGAGARVRIDLARGSYAPTFSYRGPRQPVAAPPQAAAGNGMPSLRVRPFEVFADAQPGAVAVEALHQKINEAFARFDSVNIVLDTPGAERQADYELTGSLDLRRADIARVHFNLTDQSDGMVIWSRGFERMRTPNDRAATENAILIELAATLLQPFGVIRAHERLRHLAAGGGDPRYRAVVEASESFRSFDPAQHLRARIALEELTAADPGFAMGFAYLAAIYFREYQYGTPDPPGRAILDRALEVARRAVELKPESARAYQILFGVLFARHEVEAAFAAGDKAMALNPYDMTILNDYGGRLVMIGEVERGMPMLRRAAAFGTVRPVWHHFYLFLGSYLTNDLVNTLHHANQMITDHYSLGLVARALAARRAGDPVRAKAALATLRALGPGWRRDLRGELDKFFPAAQVADRIAEDLSRIERTVT